MDIRRVFSGLNMIAVGLILLANTLGYLPWSVWWNILSLWPLLLVAAGLDILGKAFEHQWMRAVSGGVVLAGLVFGALVMPAGSATNIPGVWTIGAVDGVPYEQTVPRQGTVREGTLKLSEGASDVAIGPAGDGILVSMKGRASQPVPVLSVATNRLSATANISRPTTAGPVLGGSTMEVGLSREIAWRGITLESGASNLRADLSDIWVSALTVQAGASSVTATLGALTDSAVDISAGASSVTLYVPSEAKVTVVSDSALVGSDLPGFERTSGTGFGHTAWVHEPSGGAPRARITVELSMGAGSLNVRIYPGTAKPARSAPGSYPATATSNSY